MSAITVEPALDEDLVAMLHLFAGYQRFYEAEPDDARNRAFFARFVAPSDEGVLLVARDGDDGEPLGFACVYWTYSSVRAREAALMNDLFVVEHARRRRVGKALIEAAAEQARAHGKHTLSWETAPDNVTAQRLYDRTGATRATWLEYELEL